MMDSLRPQSRRRKTVSEEAQRLLSYAWILASLALPVLGVVLLSEDLGMAYTSGNQPTHTVSAGETLSVIARRYGVSVDDIVRINGLNDPNLIFVGQTLVIPVNTESSARQQVYTVQRGDTLGAIARRFDISIDELAAANEIDNPNRISVGQMLTIPSGDAVPVAEAPEAPPDTTYTLQRGDSLYRISLVYGVTVDDLLSANQLANPNSIYPGLILRIPEPVDTLVLDTSSEVAEQATGGRSYAVLPGDTLARIALSHNTTVDGIVAANGLHSPDNIYPGQLLRIPEPGAAARAHPAQTATAHSVQPGETLVGIALRYGVTVHSLAIANDLESTSHVYPGMALSIPAAQAGSNSVRYASVGDGLCQGAVVSRSGTGYFIRPVRSYNVTQPYHALHSGVDLALEPDSPVNAADGGTVVYAGWNPTGYGNLVVLDHGNGWRTYYAHLNIITVSCGEWVARGSQIGTSGNSGNSTGPHLHFEMLRFGIAIDPAGYIRF